MKKFKITDFLLDGLKRSLVRFRHSKFGLLFIVNIFKVPSFLKDERINIVNKLKVIFALAVGVLYFVSGIDFIPEWIVGMFGFIDDTFVLIWSLGIVNEEIENYKKLGKNPNIIEDVEFYIKDEE